MADSTYTTPRGLGQATFRAMGTTITLLAPLSYLAESTQMTAALFEEWEQALSRFHPDSEAMRLATNSGQWVNLSPILYRALTTALDAARATHGLFDPTLRERMIEIGYDRDFAELETLGSLSTERDARPAETGLWRHIEVNDGARMARLPHGVGLDFGGIGKGMAVDAALNALSEAGISPALVSAGGDLAVHGLPEDDARWTISVPGKDRMWAIGLERGALATSGVERRRWRQGNIQRHHLLDPRTGEPTQSGLWSVTAAAGTCAQAEVAAKTALILGADRGMEFIEEAALGALLVADDSGWRTAGAWPRAAMRPLTNGAREWGQRA